MWISVCSLPEWRSQITLFFPLFYGNVLIFSIKRQMYSNHLLYCSWWISRFLWYTSPPGAICKSDAAGSIQIKIALFFPGGEIHFFTQSVINCTHTHTHAQWVQYSATYPLCADSSTRDLNPPPSGLLIDGGRTESWENVWSFSAARFNSLSAFLKTWQFKDEEVFKRCGDAAPRCVDHFICLMSVSHTASHVAARCDEPRWGGWLCAILSQAAVD